MSISIIIPTLNEADTIVPIIHYLKQNSGSILKEIIVSDGGSQDNTLQLATNAGANAYLSSKKGRAGQMNHGARIASGEILYFVHADTFPPVSYATNIVTAVQNGFSCGRFRTEFNKRSLLLRLNAFFTRFDLFVCYGGDQTFFITSELFNRINGFKEDMLIMEDYDITVRAKAYGRYKIFSDSALISARKYETNSWFQVQKANYTIVQMFKKGASQQEMVQKYKELLNYR